MGREGALIWLVSRASASPRAGGEQAEGSMEWPCHPAASTALRELSHTPGSRIDGSSSGQPGSEGVMPRQGCDILHRKSPVWGCKQLSVVGAQPPLPPGRACSTAHQQ